MGLFSPAKKHANQFRYTPRFYDPERERREQRCRELHGRSSHSDGAEYTPGEYLRTMRDARRLSNTERPKRQGSSIVVWLLLSVLLLGLFVLAPRIAGLFTSMQTPQCSQQQMEYEEFNPYAPITIVPNDYKEE